MPNRPLIGRPLAYMAARLDPKPGAIQTADELHQDYVTWCGEQRLTALKAGAFREELVALARQTGIGLAAGHRRHHSLGHGASTRRPQARLEGFFLKRGLIAGPGRSAPPR